ncbi:MAG TPA: GTPase, partial [Pyrodictium sp.]|nr:GTPase [Pyrodictium sp.]
MYFIVFVGPAGSGKSHLVDAFGDWLEFNELSVARVNLDPAAEWLPYEPDVDVREYVDARKVM